MQAAANRVRKVSLCNSLQNDTCYPESKRTRPVPLCDTQPKSFNKVKRKP